MQTTNCEVDSVETVDLPRIDKKNKSIKSFNFTSTKISRVYSENVKTFSGDYLIVP
jgi:hypothetical protein